jgi:DNA-binding transcriptional ArsR family regulator
MEGTSPGSAAHDAPPSHYRSTEQLTVGSDESISNQMVELLRPGLDSVFHALADPTRRTMLGSLALGERSIGALAAPHAMSFAAASKHVKVLERAGLVRRRVVGRSHLCRIEARPLAVADEWLRFYERLWNQSFDALDDVLNEPAPSA